MKPQRINPVPGTQELFELLSFVLDAKAVKERLDFLESYRNEINELIDVHGSADQIESLKSAASEDRAKAADTLQKAQARAKAIVEDAEREASTKKTLAESSAKGQREALEERAAGLSARESVLAAHEESVKVREEEARRERAMANSVLAEGNRLQEEYEAKLAKLRAAGVS